MPGHQLPWYWSSYFWVRWIIPWITLCNTDTIWMITHVWRAAYYIIINVPLWHFLSPGLRHHVISCGLISLPYISGNMHRVCSLSCLSYECLMSAGMSSGLLHSWSNPQDIPALKFSWLFFKFSALVVLLACKTEFLIFLKLRFCQISFLFMVLIGFLSSLVQLWVFHSQIGFVLQKKISTSRVKT